MSLYCASLNKVGHASARAMISGIFQTREAWRDSVDTNNAAAFTVLGKAFGNTNSSIEWSDLILPKDFELQLGYAFAGSSSDGSAAAGSGHAFGETSIGWDWFKIIQEPKNPWSPVYTVGPEIFGGFNSDSSYHRLHYDYGAGVAFVAGLPIDPNPDRPKLELMSRVGYAGVDSMTYGDTHDVVQMSGSVPIFSQKPALQIECEARLPIIKPGALGEFGYLSVGGALYKTYDRAPDTWTMYVAISIPLENLLKAIPTAIPTTSIP